MNKKNKKLRVWKCIGILDSIVLIVASILYFCNIINFISILPVLLGILVLSVSMEKIVNEK